MSARRPRACHVCGCTETAACPGRCWWIGADLCSSCGPHAARHLKNREPKRITRRFWFRRYVQPDLMLVTWQLSYRCGPRVAQIHKSFEFSFIQDQGRQCVAHLLRCSRAELRHWARETEQLRAQA